jgi:hypothetical protein
MFSQRGSPLEIYGQMDAPMQNVAAFLETLQAARLRLYQVGEQYRRRGVRPTPPIVLFDLQRFFEGTPLIHDEGPFRGALCLGFVVVAGDGKRYDKQYEMSVDILWSPALWVIRTHAWTDAEGDGQELLRALPERTATDLGTCLAHIRAAVEDLAGFADLVPVVER